MDYDNDHNSELEKAKTRFLNGMSNEIQRVMKDVLKHSDLIKRTGLSEEQNGYIDTIYANAHKLSWVVNDILDFCRLELGKVDLQSIDFNIEYLINDIFRKAVEQKKTIRSIPILILIRMFPGTLSVILPGCARS